MQYLLLLNGNSGYVIAPQCYVIAPQCYVIAPQCYVCTHIVCLMCMYILIRCAF